MAEQFEAVHPGQFNVGKDDVGSEFGELRERFFAAADAEKFVIPLAEQRLVSLARVLLVFDDQNALER
jgi:hypothetical protein